MLRLISLIVFSLFYAGAVNCQPEELSSKERRNLIYGQLSKNSFKKVGTIEKDESSAKKMMRSSDEFYEEYADITQKVDAEKDKKKREKLLKSLAKLGVKAVKMRVAGLKYYHDSYVQRYKLYKEDLKKFYVSNNKELIDSARTLEKEAYQKFESADLAIQKTYYITNSDEVFAALTKAFNAEKLGLLYLEKSYGLFLNWGEKTSKKLDKEILSGLTNMPQETKNKNETVVIKDSIHLVKKIVYDTVKVAIQEETELVIYSIQLAASKKPLTLKQLKSIYPNNELITYEIEDSWYKYRLGYFKTYTEAQNFKISLGISDAFVVAYKNGEKTPIKELVNHSSYKVNKP